MGIFSNLKTAQVNADFDYLAAGRYWIRIDKVKQGETRKHIQFVAIEGTVISVRPSNEKPEHSLGDEVSHLMMAGNDYFEKDVVKFFTGTGIFASQEDMSESVMASLVNEDPAKGAVQPLKGYVFECDNKTQTAANKDPSAEAGSTREFTKKKFLPLVSFADVAKELSPELQAKFFPGNFLGKKIAEAAAAAK